MNKISFTITFLIIFSQALYAIEEKHVPEKRHTPYGLYLTPQEAYEMKKLKGEEIIFIDVRTRPEIKYIGVADNIDANIPTRFINTEFTWSEKSSTYRTIRNENFINDVDNLLALKGKDRSTPIMLMCQSGSRSTPAIKLMHKAGFKEVYNLHEGFEGIKAKSGPNKGKRTVNGWINVGMPWGYKLDKKTMYFNFDSSKTK